MSYRLAHLLERLVGRIEDMNQTEFDQVLAGLAEKVDALIAAFEAARTPAEADLSAEGATVADVSAKVDAALAPPA